MTPESEEALGLWESGELSRDELARRFSDEDIEGVLDAFDRMTAAALGTTPDAGAAWIAVRARLPARLADRRRGRGKAIRLLAAAMIAVLVLGASAYAVVPSVRRAMNDAAGVITGGPDRSPTPTRLGDGSGTDQITPDTSGHDGSATGSDDGALIEEDTETDADGGSNSGSNDEESDSGSGADDGSTGDEGSDDASGGGSSGSEEDDSSDAGDGEDASSGSDETDS